MNSQPDLVESRDEMCANPTDSILSFVSCKSVTSLSDVTPPRSGILAPSIRIHHLGAFSGIGRHSVHVPSSWKGKEQRTAELKYSQVFIMWPDLPAGELRISLTEKTEFLLQSGKNERKGH